MPAISGRPDGRLSKYIYAEGFGGVCRDMRYSANGVDLVDFAEADQRVKNGTYRGFEKPLFTRFYQNAFSGYFAAENTYNAFIKTGASGTGAGVPMYISGLAFKDPIIMWNSVTNQMVYGVVSDADGYVIVSPFPRNLGQISHQLNLFRNTTDLWYFAKVTEQPSSVGGSFLQTDVIGNPANILATPALANGWQGSWIPVIPDGVRKSIVATRKRVENTTTINRIQTINNGTSFSVSTESFDIVKNARADGHSALSSGSVAIYQYQAFAKQTENTVNRGVYGTFSGIGGVFVVSDHYKTAGGLLAESAAGLVLKSNFGVTRNFKTILTNALGGDNEPQSAGGHDGITHTPLTISAPTNNSHAFKALNYNVNTNQQAFIQYAYTELKYDGTNWGDDGKVTIVDNQSTKTDLNGNTILVGTAKLKESLGWIKNEV